MFYEKLAEAKEEKKRSGLADTLILGSALAGGYGSHKGVSGHVDQFIEKRRSKALMDNVGREEELWDRLGDAAHDVEEWKRQRKGIYRRFKRLDKGLKIGGGVVGATAVGYGAKKLFDRFNQRKQQRD